MKVKVNIQSPCIFTFIYTAVQGDKDMGLKEALYIYLHFPILFAYSLSYHSYQFNGTVLGRSQHYFIVCLIGLQCLKLWRTGFDKSETHMCCIGIALFLGLSCFYLPFVFTIIHGEWKTSKKAGKAREHSSHEWMRGGCRGGGDDHGTSRHFLVSVMVCVCVCTCVRACV